jgi:RND family efflux transporter MFP subunit
MPRRVSVVRSALALLIALLVAGGVALGVRDRRGEVTRSAGTGDAVFDARARLSIDGRRQQLIGVRTARASRGALGRSIRTVGTVQYDETRLTDVNLKLDGWITGLQVNHVGQAVTKGQPLFSLYSPELIAAQNDFVAALKSRDKTSPTTSQSDQEARLVEGPRQRLMRWGVPDDQIQAVAADRSVRQALIFRSPAAGVIVEKAVINGMYVEAGETLYRIADLSVVWVEADFREFDLREIRIGATAEVTADAWPGLRLSGPMVHIYPYMTSQTRTVKARIALANRGGRLKPGMFTNVEVAAEPQPGIIVPADAVVDSGTRQIVFVAQQNGYFEPRRVAVGMRDGGRALIVEGLSEDEEVAERAAFFLDSESEMRSALEEWVTDPPSPGQPVETPDLDVRLRTVPDPPTTGDNIVELNLGDRDARLASDADVQVSLYMPPMPTMNMPAMRSDAKMEHMGQGVFRGTVSISMAGRWEVTIRVVRNGRAIATTQTSLLVR